jgi:hypothetical protein
MKEDTYGIDRFSVQQLTRMQNLIFSYAEMLGGLPRHHLEVYEKRGWLLPFLFGYDDLLWGRWTYWLDILEKGTVESSSPIPRIEWCMNHHKLSHVHKMLTRCLDHYDSTIDKFADWLLWGLAASSHESIQHVSPELNEHYYRHFDLFLVLDAPTDYFSELLSEQTGKGYKDAVGYFPTPFHVSLMMTEMIIAEQDKEELKYQTVYEPSVGCGSMLLAASNYFLRCRAQDISATAIKLCKIQMYWYAPWFAHHPKTLKGFDRAAIQIRPLHEEIDEGQLVFSL